MSAMASQITIIYSAVYSGTDRSQKTSKLRVTGLFCEGNSPVTSQFHAQMASIAENVSIRWRHHECMKIAWEKADPWWRHDRETRYV